MRITSGWSGFFGGEKDGGGALMRLSKFLADNGLDKR
jgi:hypothetical protein